MADVEYLGQRSLRVAVLPARSVYLIADSSASGLRRAVQEACTRWGGMSEPIIPVKLGGEVDRWWRQVAGVASVDQAVNVDLPPEDAAAAAVALGLELVPLAEIDRSGAGMFTVHPGTVGPPFTADFNAYVIACKEGSLCDVVAAGDLTDDHLDSLDSNLLSVRRAPDDQIARAQLGVGRTLIERTMDQFGEHASRNGPMACPAIVWVSEPDSVKDCLFFWNLRALRPVWLETVPMLLLPVDQVQYWLGFADQLGHVLARPAQFAPDVAIWSLTVEQEKLRETASHLDLELTSEDPRTGVRDPAPLRRPPFTYRTDVNVRQLFVFERTYGRIAELDVHLFKGITTVRFSSPVSFSSGGLALVRLWGSPFEGLPRRPAVAELVAPGGAWSHGAIQIRALALDDYRLELHVPDLQETVTALLDDATASHVLSDKGQLGLALQESAEVSVLLEPGVFEVITRLTTPRSQELQRELAELRAESAIDEKIAKLAESWGGRAERRYRSASQINLAKRFNAPGVLERLCEVGWAERGLRILCPKCGLRTFILLTETSSRATCPGCQSPARYDISSTLTIYYRLNSYLDRASDQGVLPHLLVIAELTHQHPRSYFLAGTNLRFESDDEAEVDIFGVRTGEVVAGEVKTKAADFTAEQIARDTELSKRLGATTHLLAAIDDVPDNIATVAKEACHSLALNLIVLQKADLRPGMTD